MDDHKREREEEVQDGIEEGKGEPCWARRRGSRGGGAGVRGHGAPHQREPRGPWGGDDPGQGGGCSVGETLDGLGQPVLTARPEGTGDPDRCQSHIRKPPPNLTQRQGNQPTCWQGQKKKTTSGGGHPVKYKQRGAENSLQTWGGGSRNQGGTPFTKIDFTIPGPVRTLQDTARAPRVSFKGESNSGWPGRVISEKGGEVIPHKKT